MLKSPREAFLTDTKVIHDQKRDDFSVQGTVELIHVMAHTVNRETLTGLESFSFDVDVRVMFPIDKGATTRMRPSARRQEERLRNLFFRLAGSLCSTRRSNLCFRRSGCCPSCTDSYAARASAAALTHGPNGKSQPPSTINVLLMTAMAVCLRRLSELNITRLITTPLPNERGRRILMNETHAYDEDSTGPTIIRKT